jgi:hypothetical protein
MKSIPKMRSAIIRVHLAVEAGQILNRGKRSRVINWGTENFPVFDEFLQDGKIGMLGTDKFAVVGNMLQVTNVTVYGSVNMPILFGI